MGGSDADASAAAPAVTPYQTAAVESSRQLDAEDGHLLRLLATRSPLDSHQAIIAPHDVAGGYSGGNLQGLPCGRATATRIDGGYRNNLLKALLVCHAVENALTVT